MFILLLSILTGAFAEIFQFKKPGDSITIRFTLDPQNINTGFFQPDENSDMLFKVKIATRDNKRILYQNDSLPKGLETHFSFNNSDSIEVILSIVSFLSDDKARGELSEIQMKFESTADTFDTNVSKEIQYKPAINALNHLLAKLNSITTTTKEVYNKSENLRLEQKKTISFVVMFSILSLFAFAALNFVKLYLMKSYLNEKKYL